MFNSSNRMGFALLLIQSHNSMFTSAIQRRNQLLKEVCKNFQPPGNFRMNACL